MYNYWYNHNPSLTLFYTSIILLEKSYQFFIDDALLSLNYHVTEYTCDNEKLLEKFKESSARPILISAFTYLTKQQRILLALKLNKKINKYLKLVEIDKIDKRAYEAIKQIAFRLHEEQMLLESIVVKSKISDFITDAIMKIVMIKVFRQWKELMSEDYHGYHGFKCAAKFIKSSFHKG